MVKWLNGGFKYANKHSLPQANSDQLYLNVMPSPSLVLIVYEMRPADSAFNLHTAVFFSLQPLCLMHTEKPTGVAVSHCITWFQTQLILTTCQIRYHGHQASFIRAILQWGGGSGWVGLQPGGWV